jgi:predicted AlkP superfamily pyrophosphatase or phosphodiesterase
MRIVRFLVTLTLLAAAAPLRAQPAPRRPKLVVVLVMDQMREATLHRLAPRFGPGGFARLLKQGATLSGHYGQQNTYTGPGHATILSGAYGYLNGIMQNKWYNRAAKRSEAMLFDPQARHLSGPTDAASETSPRNFLGTTVGDELILASGRQRAKVVAVAVKERGSLLTGGRLGHAYYLDEATGLFTTSTYYMPRLPAWAQAFNARRPLDAFFGKRWERLLPEAAYTSDDDVPGEGTPDGLGRTFPHPLTGKDGKLGPSFYKAMALTPMATDLTFDFARAALVGERLGGRGPTDLLSISISTTDLAGHTWGDYSQEYEDVVLRLDRSLAAFLADVDRRFKPGEVVILLTADHGAVPMPEYVARYGIEGGRIKKAVIKQAVDRALSARFGAGKWVVALEDPSVYLDHDLIAAKKLDPVAVERVAGEALLAIPGITGFYTRTQIMNGWLPPTAASQAVARSYFPPRCGDVVLVTRPFFYWGKYGEKDVGSTHGSFYRYDTDVPVVFAGAPFKPGRHGAIEMVDVAATLAHVLGLAPPAACEGRVIDRILK